MINNLNKIETYINLDHILRIEIGVSNWKQLLEKEVTKYLYQFLAKFNQFFPKSKIQYDQYTNVWNLIINLPIFNEVPNNINKYINFLNSNELNNFIQSLYIIIDKFISKVIEYEINNILEQIKNKKQFQPNIIRDINIYNGIFQLLANFCIINNEYKIEFNNEILKIFDIYLNNIKKIQPDLQLEVIKRLQFLNICDSFQVQASNVQQHTNKIIIINSLFNKTIQTLFNKYSIFILNNKILQTKIQDMTFQENFIKKYIEYFETISTDICSTYRIIGNKIVKTPCSLEFFSQFQEKIKLISVNLSMPSRNQNILPLIFTCTDFY